MSIEIITLSDFSIYGPLIQKLERDIEYPYGEDFFKIDHGKDYFTFFRRLGSVKFNLAINSDEVVGCAAGVLRTVRLNASERKCWYLCDLKIRKDFLGRRIPSMLFKKNLIRNYFLCGRGYAISMNPSHGENRVVKIIKKLSWLPFSHADTLNFYNLSYDEVSTVLEPLNLKFGSKNFLSLEGTKDLVMKSSGKRLPLLHYQYGQFADPGCGPQVDATHMFCAPKNSELDKFLAQNFSVQTTASVIAHRMSNVNWDFILSSDI